MNTQSIADKIMPPKKEALGHTTPITLGLALAIFAIIVGGGFKAGSIHNEIDGLKMRLIGVEQREERNAKQNIDLITKLARIETLLESANAAIADLKRENPRQR